MFISFFLFSSLPLWAAISLAYRVVDSQKSLLSTQKTAYVIDRYDEIVACEWHRDLMRGGEHVIADTIKGTHSMPSENEICITSMEILQRGLANHFFEQIMFTQSIKDSHLGTMKNMGTNLREELKVG